MNIFIEDDRGFFMPDEKLLIDNIYHKFCSIQSDINQHLLILKGYANKCNHITEMGARYGLSTFTFLSANRPKFISYDLESNSNIELAEKLAKEENVNFTFIEKNVLEVKIENTDLLFIDTWHKYGQLKEELKLHAKNVNKYLIFHDTTSYEFKDEPDWSGTYKESQKLENTKSGVWPAIEEFLDQNKNWQIDIRLINNNGLTILKKI